MTVIEQALVGFKICSAILDCIKECPDGIPGGLLYASLMGYGCSLETYESLMSIMIDAGRVRKSGDLYFYINSAN